MSKKQYRERGTDTPDAPTPIVRIDTAENRRRVEEAERVDVFDIDGTVYSMPKLVRAEVGLNYLSILRNRGTDEAAAYLMEETLGEDALKALRAVEGLTEAQFEGVMKVVKKYTFPKDRSRKGAA